MNANFKAVVVMLGVLGLIGVTGWRTFLLFGLFAAAIIWLWLKLGNISLNQAPHGGSGSSIAKYRTQDGCQEYLFEFVPTGATGYRIYIIEQPGYGIRADDCHSTHRFQDSKGKFICWSSTITAYEDAKAIAKMWAEATEKYRKTGQRF